MNAAMNQLGSELFGSLGQLSLELAVLAAVVLLAGRVLRIKSPALRHFLWVAVLFKPIVALTISLPWTVFTPLLSFLESGWLALGSFSSGSSVEVPGAAGAASPIIDGSPLPLTFAGWVAGFWVLGSALLMGRILIGYGVLWRLRRQARVHRAGRLFGALRKARLALDLNPGVEVATSGSIHSPIVLGILRPLIVVPADLLEKLRADELELVLMHELAHVRRYDNLTLLIQRLIAMALFFHPAVWLCGRMLRQEAEQACDDLVIYATGRSADYARGLTGVAELAHLKTHLKRRIPIMNVFAAAESNLAQRIRRALAGRARRMGTRSRVLAALVICGVCAVALPSIGLGGSDDEIDWNAVRTTAPEEWSEELKAQIVAAGHDLDVLSERVRQGQRAEATRKEPSREDRIWQAAMATDPDEWSERLKAAILDIAPGRTIDEISEWIRQRQAAVRERGTAADSGDDDRLREFQRGVAERAMAIAPEEWDEELKAAIVRAGWDLAEFTEAISKRQAAGESGDATELVESLSGTGTAVEARSWGQIKAGIANPE